MKKEVANSMTLVDFVDYCVEKTAEQGIQCLSNGVCSYGNDKGQHCLMGWGLDEDDQDLMELFGGAQILVSDYGPRLPQHMVDNVDLFASLQDVHDLNSTEEDRRNMLDRIQRKYGINTTGEHWTKLTKLINMDDIDDFGQPTDSAH